MFPRVYGEPSGNYGSYTKSYISRNAKKNRKTQTPAERRLRSILANLNNGCLRGRYKTQHVISGSWIVDFFFPDIRLAIEVDGSIHNTPAQILKDQQKDLDCKEKYDITMLRIKNAEVFGNRSILIDKLRNGWRAALQRKNKIIGKSKTKYNKAL